MVRARAATVMPSSPRLMLSTNKPLGNSQRLDMSVAIDAILPDHQGEPLSVARRQLT
jgi:hypothetical protein